jgi:acyl-CoA synthetase (AMP-forming)/AMP-acid ligase II/nitroreductase
MPDHLAAKLKVMCMKDAAEQNNWSDWQKMIKGRRTVRAYLDKQIPQALLEQILRMSQRAPSGGNLQPCKIHVLTEEIKTRLADAVTHDYWDRDVKAEDQYPYYPTDWQEPYNERRKAVAEQLYASLDIGRRDVSKKKTQQAENYNFFGAPVGIILTIEKNLSEGSWIDLGIYLGHLILVAEAAGLATAAQASFISYHKTIRQIIDIDDNHLVMCGLSLGYADETHPINQFETPRQTLAENVVWHETRSEDIGTRILNNGREFCEKPAIIVGDALLSWQELANEVGQKAQNFEAADPGNRNLLLKQPNSADFITSFLGGVLSGRNVHVLDANWPDAWVKKVQELQPDAIEVAEEAVNTGENSMTLPKVSIDNAFYTGFTSGSTGQPKGFTRSQRSWIRSFPLDTEEFDLTADDVVAALGNFSHSLPLYAVVRALYEGATSLIFRNFRPSSVLRDLQNHKATILYAVPTQLSALIDAAEAGQSIGSMRWVLSSGAKCPPELMGKLIRLFPNAKFAEFYGSSETSYISIAKSPDNPPEGSVGRILQKVSVSIHDDQGQNCAPGDIGRLYVKSPLKFMGYLGQKSIDPDGGLYVGDTGYIDDDGFLFLTGRADRMILSSARNIFPEMVEQELVKHPSVRNAAVFGVDDAKRGQTVVAVLDLVGPLTRKDIVAFCKKEIPHYAVPKHFHLTDDWLHTSSGKTDLTRIRDVLLADRLQVLL